MEERQMRRAMAQVIGVMLVFQAMAGSAAAEGPAPVPEIGPMSISAGLAVLTGGVLIFRARRNRK